MNDHDRKILDTTCDHRLEHGVTGACGECYEQRGTYIKGLSQRIADQQAVIDAARPMMDEIQKQLEQMDGWTQFEFFSPEIDVYKIYKIRTALAKLRKSDG